MVFYQIVTPYHPKTNGQVKLSNRELKSISQKTIDMCRKDWSKKLMMLFRLSGLLIKLLSAQLRNG